MHHAQVELRSGIPLLRSLACPLQCQIAVLGHTLAHQAQVTQCPLGFRQTLLRGQVKPFGGLLLVWRQALAQIEHFSKPVLGLGISFFRQRRQLLQGCGVLRLVIGGQAFVQPCMCGERHGGQRSQQQ